MRGTRVQIRRAEKSENGPGGVIGREPYALLTPHCIERQQSKNERNTPSFGQPTYVPLA